MQLVMERTCDVVFSPCSVKLKEIQVHRHVKDIVFITQQMQRCEEVQSEGMMFQTRIWGSYDSLRKL